MTPDQIIEVASSCAPRGSDFDRCVQTVARLRKALHRHGVETAALRVRGARRPNAGTDPRWLRLPAKSWTHYVAWLPAIGIAVDATGRQFGIDGLRTLDMKQLEDEWDEISVIT